MSNASNLATLTITAFRDVGTLSITSLPQVTNLVVNNQTAATVNVTPGTVTNLVIEKTLSPTVLYGAAPGIANSGPQGIQGPTGPTGPTGPQGNTGNTGADGLSVYGYTGAEIVDGFLRISQVDPFGFIEAPFVLGYVIGATGNTGNTGNTGGKGDKGDQGDPGIAGISGYGYTGAEVIGNDLFISLVDPDGTIGSQYPIGNVRGPTGSTGPTGADSTVPGPEGPIGPEGPQGPTGPTGEFIPVGYGLTYSNIDGSDEYSINYRFGGRSIKIKSTGAGSDYLMVQSKEPGATMELIRAIDFLKIPIPVLDFPGLITTVNSVDGNLKVLAADGSEKIISGSDLFLENIPNYVETINGCTGNINILGTTGEIEVTGPCPNIIIGLPDNVIISGNLEVQGNINNLGTINIDGGIY